jgi:NTP pyrophosphatase (non-canonical NTP hydrolase)
MTKSEWCILLPKEESDLLESICDKFGLNASAVFTEWLRGVEHGDSQGVQLSLDMYQEAAMRTASPGAPQALVEHAILKLAGEAGELADHLAKYRYQRHDWDVQHVALEAGDVLWHVAELAAGLGMKLSEIGHRNIEKLRKRYPDGFDEERSRNRNEYRLMQAGYIAKPDAKACSDLD